MLALYAIFGARSVDAACDFALRAINTVAPVTNVVCETYSRGAAMLRSLPPVQGAPDIVWSSKQYPMFLPEDCVEDEKKRQEDMLAFFIDPNKRAILDDSKKHNYLYNYVLCALYQARAKPMTPDHSPNLGLDLMVIFGCRSIHDEFVIEHYRSELFGAHRDTLFQNVLRVCQKDSTLTDGILKALDNPSSLLHQTLKDHRIPCSYKAISHVSPDTICELRTELRRLYGTQTANTIVNHINSPKQ